jgi:hypothetical protein
MSVTLETGSTLTVPKFWSWLRQHPNCILRAGTYDCFLYDQEAFHWHLEEDADHNPLVQVIQGKQLVAELALDLRELLFVKAMPDPDAAESGQYLFELMGGPQAEPYAVYHFVLSHGFEQEIAHPGGGLKH